MAFYFSHFGYFAEVVQATVATSGDIKLDHVWVVGDVGSQIINPSGAENQAQGAALDGLGAALGQATTIDRGRVVQANFDTVKPLRINQAPPVEVHFLTTDHPPTGLGERRCRRSCRRCATPSSPRPASASADCRSTRTLSRLEAAAPRYRVRRRAIRGSTTQFEITELLTTN